MWRCTEETRRKPGAFAEAHGIPASYSNLDEVLEKEEAQVVDICLPNYLHHEACLKAAAAGKHVIIEKAPGGEPGAGG